MIRLIPPALANFDQQLDQPESESELNFELAEDCVLHPFFLRSLKTRVPTSKIFLAFPRRQAFKPNQ